MLDEQFGVPADTENKTYRIGAITCIATLS